MMVPPGFRCGRAVSVAEAKRGDAERGPDWLGAVAERLPQEYCAFMVVPLFDGPIPDAALDGVENFYELAGRALIKSDLGLSPERWHTLFLVSLSAEVLVSRAGPLAVSFLEYVGVNGVLVDAVTEEEHYDALERISKSSALKLYVQHDATMLSAYPKGLVSSVRRYVSLRELVAGLERLPGVGVVEDVDLVVLSAHDFVANRSGHPVLPRPYQTALQELMKRGVLPILADLCGGKDVSDHVAYPCDSKNVSDHVVYLYHLFDKLHAPDYIHSIASGFENVLQTPLQPLGDHLGAESYHTFELDRVKYEQYQEAIRRALGQSKDPTVLIVGAGRGPLIECTMRAAGQLDGGTVGSLTAIEKNPNAFATLLQKNDLYWGKRVQLIFGDARTVPDGICADIIVSELLGSFGDNELAPECLKGVLRFLRPGGIMIPQNSHSYTAPVFYPRSRRLIADHPLGAARAGSTPHVVYTRSALELAGAEPVFAFSFSDALPSLAAERSVKFVVRQHGILDGFMGYFKSELYGGVVLSTDPREHTVDMASWFPLFFPCPSDRVLSPGDAITLRIRRCSDEEGVWYEWGLDADGSWHNRDGEHHKIRL